ncbi:Protein-S-isoprenylcysteine O-methyltransferase Ste14 [Burkholderia sp. D7]|nr:Protein-S-isoprenylcysteine O-methyltransferase Ste14 [Burkholderia sp. D7]
MKSEIPSPAGQAVVSGSLTEPPARRTASLTRDQLIGEIVMRLLAVLMYSVFVSSALYQFHKDPSRITLLLLVISELLTLGLAVCTRVPRERDWNPVTVVISLCASFYFLAFRIAPGIHLLPETVAAGLQIAGLVIQVSAKLSLRRSFGILPANRGVVVGGPYRFLRHPIYFGYTVTQAGFLLSNFGVQNLVVLLILWALQMFRVVREERVLVKDARYREYAARVRYRFIPGVF